MVPRSEITAPVRRRARVVRRRRRNFARLAAAVLASLALSFVPGLRWMLLVFGALVFGLGGYMWQLRRWKVAELRRRLGDEGAEAVAAADPVPEELSAQTG